MRFNQHTPSATHNSERFDATKKPSLTLPTEYITRFEKSKQPPPRKEEIPPPPAIFQEQLSPAPVAAAATAAVSSPSRPAGTRSNRHRTPSTAECFSRRMELCTNANTFDWQNDNQNGNINNQSSLESNEDNNNPDFRATELFPPSTNRLVTTRANQTTTENDDSSLSNENNYHPDIGFVLDAPGRSEYAYKDDVDDNKEIDEDDNEEVVDLSHPMSPRLCENQQQHFCQNQQHELFNHEDLLSFLENLHFVCNKKVSLEGQNMVGNSPIHNNLYSRPDGISPNIALLFRSPLECLFFCGGLDQTVVGRLAQGSSLYYKYKIKLGFSSTRNGYYHGINNQFMVVDFATHVHFKK